MFLGAETDKSCGSISAWAWTSIETSDARKMRLSRPKTAVLTHLFNLNDPYEKGDIILSLVDFELLCLGVHGDDHVDLLCSGPGL